MNTSNEIQAYVAHTAPGRCRFKIPSKRHDAAYFQSMKETLTNTAGIERIETNPVTASILVFYDGEQVQLSDVTMQLQTAKHFEITDRVHTQTVWEQAVGGIDHIDQQLKEITAGQIDFKSALFIMLFMMAIRQLQQGSVFGAASTLFWYALQVLLKDKPT